ncbi:phage tail sheath family protein [Mucilaginibacter xinganensis]|nr:phage tail sheath C-terminal domain-containing protein [Mucilaginibacter xinganensis]
MFISNRKTPGVYVNNVSAFQNTVVPVATAVPAFVGYTPQASYQGNSYLNIPQKITSFADFQSIYCLPQDPAAASPVKQYNPQYYLVQQKSKPAGNDYMVIDNCYYSFLPDPNTIYYLYNSIRLFYRNGGGDAYIVSVGAYAAPSGNPARPDEQIVNPNVQLNDLLNGISLLKAEQEPTMYICPDATLLPVADNGLLMQAMLLQCSEMQTAISIFDIIGGKSPDPVLFNNDIDTFRTNTGTTGLDYGTAYYPFVGTTIMQDGEINYTNLFGGDIKQLALLLNPADNPNPAAASVINSISTAEAPALTAQQYSSALSTASSVYALIINNILNLANILPPSGAIAGIITTVDAMGGVWQAPANTSVTGAVSLPLTLSDSQQAGLNMDAVSGKSINAIRCFSGIGILVWGARTLDGNSDDWKYLPVRRTVTMIEQSCKAAMRAYVFQPNTQNTWVALTAAIGNFLTMIWKEGGLMGATASNAFSVNCGLGTTMTADDLLDSFMNVVIKIAIVRPGEFIVLTLQQQMATAG